MQEAYKEFAKTEADKEADLPAQPVHQILCDSKRKTTKAWAVYKLAKVGKLLG